MSIRSNHRPRGSLMVCVLVCMVVVASLVGLVARDALAARRETKLRLQLLQTERLLDAGILRSAIRSEQDSDYGGETWEPALNLAGRRANAAVVISIDGDQTTVTAQLGTEPNLTTKSSVYSSRKVQ